MKKIIGYCNDSKCNSIFAIDSIDASKSTGTITIVNSYTRCPYCGGMATIPDGIYDFFEDGYKFYLDSSNTNTTLEKLKDIIEFYKSGSITDKEEIIEKVSKVSPLFAKMISGIKDVPFYQWIFIILAIITYINSCQSNISQQDFNKKVLEQFYKTNETIEKLNHKNNTAIKKTGRNAPCPCGSGIKFKYCCIYKKSKSDIKFN